MSSILSLALMVVKRNTRIVFDDFVPIISLVFGQANMSNCFENVALQFGGAKSGARYYSADDCFENRNSKFLHK